MKITPVKMTGNPPTSKINRQMPIFGPSSPKEGQICPKPSKTLSHIGVNALAVKSRQPAELVAAQNFPSPDFLAHFPGKSDLHSLASSYTLLIFFKKVRTCPNWDTMEKTWSLPKWVIKPQMVDSISTSGKVCTNVPPDYQNDSFDKIK